MPHEIDFRSKDFLFDPPDLAKPKQPLARK